MIPIFVGFDQREAAAFHVFNQSVIEHATKPVSFHPLHGPMLNDFDGQQDGTNAFIFSRYLVPLLQGFKGWAIFCDGDQVLKDDIAKLWSLRDDSKAVMVVKHDYKTRHLKKYIGSPIESGNIDYPRKNWSSVMLWNCAHPANAILSRQVVAESGGAFLHRFQWLKDDEIGEIPKEWNWLVGEDKFNPDAKLVHYTLGIPGFGHYMRCDYNSDWNTALLNALNVTGEQSSEIVRRALWRSHGGSHKLCDVADGDSRLSGEG